MIDMDDEKLIKIREFIKNEICRNHDIMHNPEMRDAHIPEIIVGLYEYLHHEVTGEHYEYMFHWANKIGSWVDTYDFDKYLERGEWNE